MGSATENNCKEYERTPKRGVEERSILADLANQKEPERQCICGKICKNSKGLKIHMHGKNEMQN